MQLLFLTLLFLLTPSTAWAFVPHAYPGEYVNVVARAFFFAAHITAIVLMMRSNLHKQKGWRYFVSAMFIFSIWNIVVFTGRLGEKAFGAITIVHEVEGWQFFKRVVVIDDTIDFFLYFTHLEQIFLVVALILFYMGLREHSQLQQVARRQKEEPLVSAAVLLPVMPLLISDMAGAIAFVVLAVLCLAESIKLYKADKENAVWYHMVVVSAIYVMYSISRTSGQLLLHILTMTGNLHMWVHFDAIPGSINTLSLFGIALAHLTFLGTYRMHLTMLDGKKKIEDISKDTMTLIGEMEQLGAERTTTLMSLKVADSIRNPVIVIGCNSKRIINKLEKYKVELPKGVEEGIQDIFEECNRLEDIVSNFGNMRKARQRMFKYEDINEVAKSVVSSIGGELSKKGVHLRTDFNEEPLRINMQKGLLRVSLFHLLRNAIDATPKDGTIDVKTFGADDKVSISISDTGYGISEADISRIYDPLYSTKAGGFGMGLPLVKQVVSEHLGELKVESKVGVGTTFEMVFDVKWCLLADRM